jgi:hypothetical protein
MTWRERGLFVRAYLGIAAVDLRMRLRAPRSYLHQGPVERAGGVTEADIERAWLYSRWITSAARFYPARAQCLHQSLALQSWLCREGLPADLRIGVHKEGNELKAHAWVELGGRIVNDTDGAIMPFTPLFRTLHEAANPSGDVSGIHAPLGEFGRAQ